MCHNPRVQQGLRIHPEAQPRHSALRWGRFVPSDGRSGSHFLHLRKFTELQSFKCCYGCGQLVLALTGIVVNLV